MTNKYALVYQCLVHEEDRYVLPLSLPPDFQISPLNVVQKGPCLRHSMSYDVMADRPRNEPHNALSVLLIVPFNKDKERFKDEAIERAIPFFKKSIKERV